ncbi:MAG TPA: 2-oxo-4-hydroxy-4-carboxy-5-ureidoimidazoline decarboxylase [Actinomycetes bacterium]|nr:2-oxo-4-hydroxy-4-carboxy-5-ureidoimidazoline decarboxylase [Actinomycetes bacterium]
MTTSPANSNTQPADSGTTMDRFDALPAEAAERELRACCASATWVRAVVNGRPYRDLDAVLDASAAAFAELTDADVDEALAAHPRIGERAAGNSREAAWSRQEQSGAADADANTTAALAAGNRAYEERFDRVFLICATGLSAAQLLAELEARLGNDEATERAVIRTELAKIAALRLERMLGG